MPAELRTHPVAAPSPSTAASACQRHLLCWVTHHTACREPPFPLLLRAHAAGAALPDKDRTGVPRSTSEDLFHPAAYPDRATSGGKRGARCRETTVTKSGSDRLKRRAREIARTSRQRYPDVLDELRRTSSTARQPSKDLVLVCDGMAHPINGGRCARTAGHHNPDGGWGWCGWGPNAAVNVWDGYYRAEMQAQQEQEEARRAALTPEERADEDAEYWADRANAFREPYDSYDDKYDDLADELRDETQDPDENLSGRDCSLYDDEHGVTF